MNRIKPVLLLLLALCLAACVSYYDHYTLTETVTTKVMAQNLLAQADEQYTQHRSSVEAFQQQLDKMLLYEQTKDRNEIMEQMWALLHSPDSSIQRFLTTWEEQGSMSPVFIEEYQPQIEQLFQLMIDYENKKDRKSESALLQVLQSVTN